MAILIGNGHNTALNVPSYILPKMRSATTARRWHSGQEGKSWKYGSVRSCSQLPKRHWFVQSEFVSPTLEPGVFESSSSSLRASAEERFATHTPIRENDVDHFWAYSTGKPGPGFQLTVEKLRAVQPWKLIGLYRMVGLKKSGQDP